ncbi:MAG: ABC-F family ATP-binding cassette domain-containing protein [Caldilineaceae bacterium]
MNLVTISNLSKQFSERLLFDNANLLINEGDRIGLIGVNGSGKSTLLKIVAGIEAADEGSISIPGRVRVEYVAQEPPLNDNLTVLETLFASDSPQMVLLRNYEITNHQLLANPNDLVLQERLHQLTDEMDRTGGWSAENNARIVLTKLGIEDLGAKVGTLSGGQRKRVALARSLIDRADLLILDEPTNHIDAATVAWLEEYLATEPGGLLMVTHDRYFLDRVVNKIVEIDRRQLVAYAGNYSRYLEQSEARSERLATDEAKRQNLLRRELEWLRRGAMARGTKQKARKDRVLELMQIRYDQGGEKVAIALGSRRLGSKVLTARNISKRYDARQVLNGLDLSLEAGDRIGIVAPNGAGKSTLLDILTNRTTADGGSIQWGETVQIGYYDQRSVALEDRTRILDFIEKSAAIITTKEGEKVDAPRMLEWFLFPRPMQYARIGSLSGGERRRLYLLYTLIHQPNVLLLDEPTNDLDIQTLGVLEEYLDHFQGCLIVASHDRYFLDRTVDYLVDLEDGKLGPRYPTPWEVYQRLRQEEKERQGDKETRRQENSVVPSTLVTPHSSPLTLRSPKLSWKEQRELETVENRLAQLEAKKQQLQQEINNIGDEYQRLSALNTALNEVQAELDEVELRWLELAK